MEDFQMSQANSENGSTQAIQGHLDAYERDMRHDYTYHVSHIDNVLYAMVGDKGAIV